ncbi:MAG: tyrosine-type recombinase/integrase [candidate division Zixibacteria bacterium]|jgi:site-specific recombinase XerD|nr:tyrosine-type recombinase/integrase [candidate division Zixibacteria bacterium]
MGTIYKRGRVYYINVVNEGKRVRKRVGTSRRVAEQVLSDSESKIARKRFDLDVPDGSLAVLFDAYLDFSKTNHAPSTTLRYGQVIRNFRLFLDAELPEITRVSQLSPKHLEGFKKWRKTTDPRKADLPERLAAKVAPNALPGSSKTINYEVKTLRAVFRFGQQHGLCSTNPTDGIRSLKVVEKAEPRFLTQEECCILLGAAADRYRPIFYTFLNTGLRLGELTNLQWGDIDLARKVLKVQQKVDWTPKAGERQIPLNNGMCRLLKEIKPPKVRSDAYVFTRRDGKKLGGKLRAALESTARRAGLRDITKVHTLRHTFASHLVMKGVDLPTVQRLLGHSDIQTTMIYAHLAPEHLVGAIQKLEFDQD